MQRSLSAACLLLLASPAFARGVPTAIGPFSTGVTDGFEDFALGAYDCSQQGTGHTLLGNSANMCNPNSSDLLIEASNSGASCGAVPARTGAQLLTNKTNTLQLLFQPRVKKFGGYFLAASGTADATADFYDATGLYMGSLTLSVAADCAWHWNGWQAPVGQDIQQVRIVSTGNGALLLDDLIVDYVDQVATRPTIYCTSKTSSKGCTPTIYTNYDSSLGQIPSATLSSGFVVGASNLPAKKNCVIFYSIFGQSALPIAGSFLCTPPPNRRIIVFYSGGTGSLFSQCDGQGQVDLNSKVFFSGNPNPNYPKFLGYPFPAGLTVCAQIYYRDPPLPAPLFGGLTDAVMFTLE